MIFESDACGWDPDPFWWERLGECKAGQGEKCDECKGAIQAGDDVTVCLHTDKEYPDQDCDVSDVDFLDGIISFRGELLQVRRHVICSKCEDLRQSLIANGNQPVFGRVWQCHMELLEYKKEMGKK